MNSNAEVEWPNLRPIARHDRKTTLVIRGLEVGVRVSDSWDLEQLSLARALIEAESGHSAPDVLYVAGLASRDPGRGHGFIWLDDDSVRVYQTDWAELDAYGKRWEEMDDEERWNLEPYDGLRSLWLPFGGTLKDFLAKAQEEAAAKAK